MKLSLCIPHFRLNSLNLYVVFDRFPKYHSHESYEQREKEHVIIVIVIMRNHVEEILKKGRSKEVFVCLLYFFCLHLIIFLLCFSFLQKSSTNSSDEYQIDSLILCLVVVSLVWNILLFCNLF